MNVDCLAHLFDLIPQCIDNSNFISLTSVMRLAVLLTTDSDAESLGRGHVIDQICSVIHRVIDINVNRHVAALLWNLTFTENNRQAIAKNNERIIIIMATYSDDAELQESCCGLLSTMLLGCRGLSAQAIVSKIISLNVIDLIVKAMSSNPNNIKLQSNACYLIENIAKHGGKGVRCHIQQLNGIGLIANVLHRWDNRDPVVCKNAQDAMTALCRR